MHHIGAWAEASSTTSRRLLFHSFGKARPRYSPSAFPFAAIPDQRTTANLEFSDPFVVCINSQINRASRFGELSNLQFCINKVFSFSASSCHSCLLSAEPAECRASNGKGARGNLCLAVRSGIFFSLAGLQWLLRSSRLLSFRCLRFAPARLDRYLAAAPGHVARPVLDWFGRAARHVEQAWAANHRGLISCIVASFAMQSRLRRVRSGLPRVIGDQTENESGQTWHQFRRSFHGFRRSAFVGDSRSGSVAA